MFFIGIIIFRDRKGRMEEIIRNEFGYIVDFFFFVFRLVELVEVFMNLWNFYFLEFLDVFKLFLKNVYFIMCIFF